MERQLSLVILLYYLKQLKWGLFSRSFVFDDHYPSIWASGVPSLGLIGSCLILYLRFLNLLKLFSQIASRLDRVVASIGRKPLKVFIQVNTSGEECMLSLLATTVVFFFLN